MADHALFSSLADFNQERQNKYRENWGSLMSFLDAEDTDALTSKINNVNTYMENKVVRPIEEMLHKEGIPSPSSTFYDRGTAATLRGTTAQKHSATARTLFSRSSKFRQHPVLMGADSHSSYVYKPDHRTLRQNQSALRSGDITVSPSKVLSHQYHSMNASMMLGSDTKSSVRFGTHSLLPTVGAINKKKTVGMKVVYPTAHQSTGGETASSQQERQVDPYQKVKARVNSFRRPTQSERAAKKMFGRNARTVLPPYKTPEVDDVDDSEFIDPNIKLKPEHHITRSLLKIQQQSATSKQLQKRTEEVQRIMDELKSSRDSYGLRNKKQDGTQRDMPPLKRPVPIKAPAARMEEAQLALDRKLGKEKNVKQILAAKENEQWLKKKRERQGIVPQDNRKHIEFAKNLFILWDDDGSGELDITEITKPLITLGLSTDSQFVKKLIKALNQRRKQPSPMRRMKSLKPNRRETDDNLTLELSDFVRIFGSDAASNRIAQVLRMDYNQRLREKQRLQAIKNRPKRESIMYKTPMSTQRHTYDNSPVHRNVSFAYKSHDLQAVIELPLEREQQWLKVHNKEFDKKEGKTSGREVLYSLKQNGSKIQKIDERKTTRSLYEKVSSTPSPVLSPKATSRMLNTNETTTSLKMKENPVPFQLKMESVPIAEQMKLVQEWWKDIAGRGNKNDVSVQPINKIIDFLLEKKIVRERERARKLILGPLLQARNVSKPSQTNINDIFFQDFKRIFTRGIFREAVLNITSSVDSQLSGNLSDLPMTLKIINYQRRLMLGGLTHEQRGADILNSLHQYDRHEAAYKAAGHTQETKSEMHFQNNETWVKSALEKGVSAKVIASLGGAAAEEALSKIRAEEARKGEISEVKDLQIVPGNFVMPNPLLEEEDEVGHDLEGQIKRNFLKKRKQSFQEGGRDVHIPLKYLNSTRRERANEENEVLKHFQDLATHVQKKNERV